MQGKPITAGRECLSSNVLTIEKVHKFSPMARAYMLAFFALEKDSEELMKSTSVSCAIVIVMIEKMVKQFKTH